PRKQVAAVHAVPHKQVAHEGRRPVVAVEVVLHRKQQRRAAQWPEEQVQRAAQWRAGQEALYRRSARHLPQQAAPCGRAAGRRTAHNNSLTIPSV
ncbi:hypothetical protein KBX18_11655, partial [Corynebacterium sp. CCUG 69979]|uniref:hypothetical protein n=1 Tax=Corynebacterium sp. CCUG 69979 TaxID=2823890 RepID=UPI00210E1B99